MKWWEVAIHIIGIAFSYYAYINCYFALYDSIFKKRNFLFLIIIFIIIIISFYNTFHNYNYTKIVISFFLLTLIFKLLYCEDYSKIIIKGLILYIIGMTVELLVGSISMIFNIESIIEFDSMIWVKVLFSTLIMLITWLLCLLKSFKRFINNLLKTIVNKKFITILIVLLFLLIVIITYNMVSKMHFLSYISQYFIIMIFIIFFIVLLSQMILIKKALEKEQILLEFIEKYEKLIDDNRINKHETINNLLMLKSIKNKNTIEYTNILDEMLSNYETKNYFNGIYNLPSGLKGIIYYKLYDAQSLGINVTINVSNKSIKSIEEIDISNFSKVCKIIGILLENAKEAAKESSDKTLLIDIYSKNDLTIVYVENGYYGEIDMSRINMKNYSTKGKGRGIGLYIVQDLLFSNRKIELEQHIVDKKFVSMLKIKTK